MTENNHNGIILEPILWPSGLESKGFRPQSLSYWKRAKPSVSLGRLSITYFCITPVGQGRIPQRHLQAKFSRTVSVIAGAPSLAPSRTPGSWLLYPAGEAAFGTPKDSACLGVQYCCVKRRHCSVRYKVLMGPQILGILRTAGSCCLELHPYQNLEQCLLYQLSREFLLQLLGTPAPIRTSVQLMAAVSAIARASSAAARALLLYVTHLELVSCPAHGRYENGNGNLNVRGNGRVAKTP